MKTEAALAAQALRAELKKVFPSTKFSVRSQTYTGGDSINVGYELTETSPTPEQVSHIANKYQEGHFDGMQNMYIQDPDFEGVGAKYVFVQADTSALMERHKEAFLNYWGLSAYDDQEIMAKLHCWKEQALHRFVMEQVVEQEGARV